MSDDAANAIQGLLASASQQTKGSTATMIGVAVLLVGATSVSGEPRDALDRIWRAPPCPRAGGLRRLLRTQLLSFGMILGVALLPKVSLVLGAVMAALGKGWGGVVGASELLAWIADLLVGFALTTGVLAMIYKLMPRISVVWRDVWLGAAVTAALFKVGRSLIGLYIGRSGITSAFGAAGSQVVVLVWVYYSAQIFLCWLGVEFTGG